jgi:hypothetical protein
MGKQYKHFPSFLLFSPGLVLFLCQPATAARLLQVYIEQNGDVVMHGYYQDGGLADAATVWRYLQRPPIMVDDDAVAVKANAASPLQAELAGDVTMRIQHVNHIIAQARLSTLALRRVDEQTFGWFLPAAEVERTAAIAGLGGPNTPSNGGAYPRAMPAIVVVLALVLTGLIAAVTFLLIRRQWGTNAN